jgi:hypothetical protein
LKQLFEKSGFELEGAMGVEGDEEKSFFDLKS